MPTTVKNADPLECKCPQCGLMSTAFFTLLAIVLTSPVRLVDGLCRQIDDDSGGNVARMMDTLIDTLVKDTSTGKV